MIDLYKELYEYEGIVLMRNESCIISELGEKKKALLRMKKINHIYRLDICDDYSIGHIDNEEEASALYVRWSTRAYNEYLRIKGRIMNGFEKSHYENSIDILIRDDVDKIVDQIKRENLKVVGYKNDGDDFVKWTIECYQIFDFVNHMGDGVMKYEIIKDKLIEEIKRNCNYEIKRSDL